MNKILYQVIICLSIIFWEAIPIEGQKLEATNVHLSTSDGLISNDISDIVQDKFGYIWIGTWSGLTRYDGFNFTNYSTGNDSGIFHLHSRILNLYPDNEGNIWMLMYDNRVFVLNHHTDKIQSAFINSAKAVNYKVDNEKIAIDSKGFLYAAIKGRGIYQLKITDGILKNHLYKMNHLNIKNMLPDGNKKLWMITNKGLYVLNLNNHKMHYLPYMHGNDKDCKMIIHKGYIFIGTPDGKILQINSNYPYSTVNTYNLHQTSKFTSLYIDRYGLLWFTTMDAGISHYNFATHKIKSFQQKVPAPESDAKGAKIFEYGSIMWIKMNHGGFGYYNRSKDKIEYFYNNPREGWELSNTVVTYYAVPEGVLFMSTINRGLEKIELIHRTMFMRYINPNSERYGINEIRAFVWDRERHCMLIGNKVGDIYAEDYKTGNKKKIASYGGRIYGLMQDHKGNIWVSNKDKGLFIMGNPKPILTSKCYITKEGHDGTIWVATFGNGVIALRHGKKIQLKNLPHGTFEKVRTLCEANNGDMWAGTTDGILIFKKEGNTYHAYPLKETEKSNGHLLSDDIIQLVKDEYKHIWIATSGGGISCALWNTDSACWNFKTISTKDGIPNDEIKSITICNKDQIWFTSDMALCCYTLGSDILTVFRMPDGIGNIQFSEGGAITLPNGLMYYGTVNGYYFVNSKKLKMHEGANLKLRITDFYINDQLQSPRLNSNYDYYIPDSGYVRIPSRSSIFGFRFASLNYQLQHRVHYQYMLDGYDNLWHNADSKNKVTFSNIPAGTYHFRVKAFLSTGKKQYDERVITVVVPPYLFASTPALWIYVILIACGITLYIYGRKRNKQAELSKMRVLKIGPQEIAFQEKNDYDFVKDQLDWLEQHYSESTLKIEEMVDHSHLSRTSYYTQLKTLTGLSPKEFISEFRLKKACMYLELNTYTIAEVAYRCGFNDPVYFTRIFKNKMNFTPTKYRENTNKIKIAEKNTSAHSY